jgi:predicted P-loop ATPase
LELALRREDITSLRIAYDQFRDEIMLAPHGTADWRAFSDDDYFWLRVRLETGSNGFEPLAKELLRDGVAAIARDHAFDSAQLWLNGLPHDGVPRIDTFLIDYFGVEDTPYHRAVSRYMWTAMAGRVLVPGVKADMVPIFIGAQGAGKSTAIAALVPSSSFSCEVAFGEKDDDLARKMKGKLVAEIAELRGLHTREREAILAFVTRTHEQWVPKFKEFSTAYPRRLVFFGSTNETEILADPTGNRRWLPMQVGSVNVNGVRRVAALLWAEARSLFLAVGVAYQEAERLARAEHDQYKIVDEWQDAVQRWLDTPDFEVDGVPTSRSHLTTMQALVGALRMDEARIGRRESMRMGAVLREMGFVRKKLRIGDQTPWGYVKDVPSVPASLLPDDQGGNDDLFL